MTQTPNGDQESEQQLHETDTDLNIGEPSPDAAYHDHATDEKAKRSSWLVVSTGALVISGILAGIIYLAYMKGIEYGQDHVPPLIAPDDSLIKVPPETNEADNFENGDLHIYGVISGDRTDNGNTDTNMDDMGDMKDMGEMTMTPSDDDMVLQDKEDMAGTDSQVMDMNMADRDMTDMDMMTETEAAPIVLTPPTGDEELAEAEIEPMTDTQNDDFVTSLAGIYAVQISSVRSLEQAEITYGRLQQKFPVLLASREPMVQRADLGERGIFFRLAITGFMTRPAAEDFCDALKEGDQDCFVRKIN